jgi:hypothetical protein
MPNINLKSMKTCRNQLFRRKYVLKRGINLSKIC